jgi:hypothetical protein
MFVVLNCQKDDITPKSILYKLKQDLQKCYPKTEIKQNKPCIVVGFNHITFELTPAIEIENYSKTHNDFYIPSLSKNNEWQTVDNPRVLEDKLSNKNQELDGMLTPLIKMIKKCKIENEIKNYSSYEMEELAIENLNYWSFDNYRNGIEKLLKIYEWSHKKYTYYDIKNFSDDRFADFCRTTLFGSDFPI